jgi:hypothetical protein
VSSEAIPDDRVADIERPGLGCTDPVVLRARRTCRGQHHPAVNHLVAVVVLEAILLVLVIAHRGLELVLGAPTRERVAEHGLHAGRVILTIVVAHPERARRARRTGLADDRREFRRIDRGALEDRAQAREAGVGRIAHVVQLVPGPLGLRVVRDRGEIKLIGEVDPVRRLVGPVLDVQLVELAAAVAPQRIGAEVVERQADVGLVRFLVRVLQLQLERLRGVRAGRRPQRELGHVVLDLEARVAARIELLEARAALLQRLEAEPHVVGTPVSR